jgi:hypothetical protein
MASKRLCVCCQQLSADYVGVICPFLLYEPYYSMEDVCFVLLSFQMGLMALSDGGSFFMLISCFSMKKFEEHTAAIF